MPASKKTATRQADSRTSPRAVRAAKACDAIALLKADHKAVDALFADYAKTRTASRKKALVQQICIALTVHAQVEEEFFYPAVKAALKDRRLVPEAVVEQK